MPVNLINRFRISKALICLSLGLIVAAGVLPSGAKTKIVSFKDAAKLKTWDADDVRSAQKWEEMRCVTREKLETLDLGLEEIGRLKVRHARDIKASGWSIGCETMDRDYSDWDQYKHFVGMLGAKRGRLFSGWAKTEQEKGVYDFAWLDRQVREDVRPRHDRARRRLHPPGARRDDYRQGFPHPRLVRPVERKSDCTFRHSDVGQSSHDRR